MWFLNNLEILGFIFQILSDFRNPQISQNLADDSEFDGDVAMDSDGDFDSDFDFHGDNYSCCDACKFLPDRISVSSCTKSWHH